MWNCEVRGVIPLSADGNIDGILVESVHVPDSSGYQVEFHTGTNLDLHVKYLPTLENQRCLVERRGSLSISAASVAMMFGAVSLR